MNVYPRSMADKKTKKQGVLDSYSNDSQSTAYDEEAAKEYDEGLEDEEIKRFLFLMGQTNADKTNHDNVNQQLNDLLKEASRVLFPTPPQYLGAKKAKQAVSKTKERLKPLSWSLQGDGASEEQEILMTMAAKEVFHRGGYDSTYTGKAGIIDKICNYGNGNRLIQHRDPDESAFPVEFKIVDPTNIYVSTDATSFRNGNKNVTQIVLVFKGTKRQFNDEFSKYANVVRPGLIPRNFTYKDLDQTRTQQNQYIVAGDNDEDQELEWAYGFDISRRVFRFFAGSNLLVLQGFGGKDSKGKAYGKYPFTFENLEGKDESYFPVSNYMCIPAEEGIYDVGLVAYLYDMCIVFRQVLNMAIGHIEENTWPHTLVGIPQGQEDAFFNLVEMADQMRAAGQKAYIPITYNPNVPGQVQPAANPLINQGDTNGAAQLMEIIKDEFRQCGVYMDEPIEAGTTAYQVATTSSNALVLPKSIMKYNAPEVEFEVMVALDMCKKYIKKGDETPLILSTTIELPDGDYSIRGIPYTLGWFKEKLQERKWRVVVDPESGANSNETMMVGLYAEQLSKLPPDSPEFAALSKRMLLAQGIDVPKGNPASAQMMTAQQAQGGQAPGGEQPPGVPNIPIVGGTPPPEATPMPQEAAGVSG